MYIYQRLTQSLDTMADQNRSLRDAKNADKAVESGERIMDGFQNPMVAARNLERDKFAQLAGVAGWASQSKSR